MNHYNGKYCLYLSRAKPTAYLSDFQDRGTYQKPSGSTFFVGARQCAAQWSHFGLITRSSRAENSEIEAQNLRMVLLLILCILR